ncbi:hypothetical protein KGM_213180 [Danaus plexippus plexippus]|uniref:Uncharacterized protein n=1 Tax=Danaus plexippus plexippus TaxID=278856 RepID=A0A212FAY0_DANPL|nr:hypothetical protein KGM_213180 [Danaus plexippus plexippus]
MTASEPRSLAGAGARASEPKHRFRAITLDLCIAPPATLAEPLPTLPARPRVHIPAAATLIRVIMKLLSYYIIVVIARELYVVAGRDTFPITTYKQRGDRGPKLTCETVPAGSRYTSEHFKDGRLLGCKLLRTSPSLSVSVYLIHHTLTRLTSSPRSLYALQDSLLVTGDGGLFACARAPHPPAPAAGPPVHIVTAALPNFISPVHTHRHTHS